MKWSLQKFISFKLDTVILTSKSAIDNDTIFYVGNKPFDEKKPKFFIFMKICVPCCLLTSSSIPIVI